MPKTTDSGDMSNAIGVIDPNDSFDLTSNVNYLLRRAHSRADKLFGEAMADIGLTPRQAALLYAVGVCPGGSISMLTRITGMDRGTLSEISPRMVARGLLLRRQDENDGRAKSLYLSKEGAELVHQVTLRSQSLPAQVLEPLPPEYHDLFIKMLMLLVGIETETRTRTDMLQRAEPPFNDASEDD